jgi:acetyl esterase/lipase
VSVSTSASTIICVVEVKLGYSSIGQSMKIRKISCLAPMVGAFLFFTALRLSAQPNRRAHPADPSSHVESTNCFDFSDPRDIRLWEGSAPGAIGDDPCKDIPYLRVFVAPSNASVAEPAILIIPGGRYDSLSDTKEQTSVAEYFSQTLSATSFVLYYRLVQKDGTYRYPVPMWDGQRAIKLIRSRAVQLGVDPRRVAMFGFSAGGHLASTLTLHSATDFGLPVHDAVDAELGRPELLGLGYPVISMDPADVPPSGSYRNLLRGFEGSELQHLQSYLWGEERDGAHASGISLRECG